MAISLGRRVCGDGRIHTNLFKYVAQETHHFNNALIKCRYRTASSRTYSYSIGEIGERELFEVVLRYRYCIWVKMFSSCLEHAKQKVLC